MDFNAVSGPGKGSVLEDKSSQKDDLMENPKETEELFDRFKKKLNRAGKEEEASGAEGNKSEAREPDSGSGDLSAFFSKLKGILEKRGQNVDSQVVDDGESDAKDLDDGSEDLSAFFSNLKSVLEKRGQNVDSQVVDNGESGAKDIDDGTEDLSAFLSNLKGALEKRGQNVDSQVVDNGESGAKDIECGSDVSEFFSVLKAVLAKGDKKNGVAGATSNIDQTQVLGEDLKDQRNLNVNLFNLTGELKGAAGKSSIEFDQDINVSNGGTGVNKDGLNQGTMSGLADAILASMDHNKKEGASILTSSNINEQSLDYTGSEGVSQSDQAKDIKGFSQDKSDSESFQDVVKSVFEQLNAAKKELNSGDEIRMPLKNQIVQDTEIILKKEKNGLSMEVETGSEESYDFFDSHLNELKDSLGQKITENLSITLLSSQYQSQNAELQLGTGNTVSDPAQDSFSSIVSDICDQVLVSEKDLHGDQEVRISLKDSVLKDTEIRIRRENDGLSIQFVTGANDSKRLLDSSLQGLQNSLENKITDKVSLSVTESQGEEMQGDQGRSRQRRNLYDEIEDD